MNMYYCFTSTCHKYIYIYTNVCVKCGHFEVSIFFLCVDVVHKVLSVCETTSSEVTCTPCALHRCSLLHTAFPVRDQLLSPLHLLVNTFRWVGGQGGVSSKRIFRPTRKPATVLIVLPCVILWLRNLHGRVQI